MYKAIALTPLLGFLALGLVACAEPKDEGTSHGTAAAAAPVAVRTRVAQLQEVARKIEASASLEAVRQVSPGSKILGRVDRVLVREGDAVKAGQLLARLENRDLQAAVAQAKAGLSMAEAQQRSAEAMARRMRDLRGRGSATEKNLEDAVAGEDIANAGVAQATANLEAAKVMLSYAEVQSPISGWVIKRQIEAGDMAAPGQPLFTIEDLSTIEARAEIPESDVAGLAPGAPATIVVDSLTRTYQSTLHRLVPAGDARSRSFEARFQLPNADGALRSGLFARVSLPSSEAREVLLLENQAIRERGQLRAVFVVDGDKARLRFVKTGRSHEGMVEILSGLEPGVRYLLEPPATLVDGAAISATEGN